VWSHRFGGLDAVSSPSVVAGRVFVSVYQTEIFGAPLQVWAFDASSGAPIWHRRLAGTDWLSAPAVAGGRVFVQSSRQLLALDARTGVTLWRRDDAIAFAEPVLAGGLVYVGQNTASCCAAGLVAYRARDGRLVWRRTISGLTQMSAPAIAGGHAYAASVSANVSNSSRRAFTLWAFDAQSGRTLWARNPPLNGSEYPNGVFATPSVARRVVYDGGLDAYSATGRRIWISNQPGGGSDVTPTVGHGFVFNELAAFDQNGGECAYRVDDGHIAWCAGDSVYDPSTLADGVLFVSDGGTDLTAYDPRTGAELYADARHSTFGQPVVADGTVYSGGYGLFAYRP
jgi:outer membrane protein assembly factor BamB